MPSPFLFSHLDLPWGAIRIVTTPGGIWALDLRPPYDAFPDAIEDPRAHRVIHHELLAYAAGRCRRFSFPLDSRGTPFQRSVWSALRDIPFGETRTYGAIAAAVGRPGAARAVGAACRTNPIGLVVPCHRVVGHDGRLTGYAGGLDLKARLLAHERSVGTS